MSIPNEILMTVYDFCDKPTRINMNRAFNWNYLCINPYKDYQKVDKRCKEKRRLIYKKRVYIECNNYDRNVQCIKCKKFYCSFCIEWKDETMEDGDRFIKHKVCYDCQEIYFGSKEWNLCLISGRLKIIDVWDNTTYSNCYAIDYVMEYIKHSAIFIYRFNDVNFNRYVGSVKSEVLRKIREFLELEKFDKVQLNKWKTVIENGPKVNWVKEYKVSLRNWQQAELDSDSDFQFW